MCDSLQGGGGDDMDVRSKSHMALAWSWYSYGGIAFCGGLPRWVLTFIWNVSLVEEWAKSN